MLHSTLRRTLAIAAFAVVVAIPAVVRANGMTIVPVTPAPDDAIASSAPTIVVDVVSGDSASLDPRTVRFVLDGRDLSDRISVSGVELTYAAHDLGSGAHRVEVAVDRGAQGRATYEYAFRVDPNAKSKTTTASESEETAPMNGALPMLGGSGSDDSSAGYSDGNLQTVGPSPYYWGDSIPFLFSGPPGSGFLTFGGIPGIFNLLPFGPGQFITFVPVPFGFAFPNPPVVCHFWHHKQPIVVHMHRSPLIVHRRDPAPFARRLALERELHVVPPAFPGQMHPVFTTLPGFAGERGFVHPINARPHAIVPAPLMRAPQPVMRSSGTHTVTVIRRT